MDRRTLLKCTGLALGGAAVGAGVAVVAAKPPRIYAADAFDHGLLLGAQQIWHHSQFTKAYKRFEISNSPESGLAALRDMRHIVLYEGPRAHKRLLQAIDRLADDKQAWIERLPAPAERLDPGRPGETGSPQAVEPVASVFL